MGKAKYASDIVVRARKIKKQVDSLVPEPGHGSGDWRPFVSELAAMVEQLAAKLQESE